MRKKDTQEVQVSQATRKLAKLVGTNIQERRKKLGLTQECLAEKIGVGQQSLSRMERGDIAPKLERLPDVAATQRCSVADLFRASGADDHALTRALEDALAGLNTREKEYLVRMTGDLAALLREARKSG